MSDNYFKTGLENLKKIDGTAGSNVIENLSDIAPDLARYIIEFAFGQIYERPGLSLQERELLTLSSLLTAGWLRSPAAGTYSTQHYMLA